MGTIFISENACRPLLDRLAADGHKIYLVRATETVYPAIAAHPDIYMCRAGNVLVADETLQTEPSLRAEYDSCVSSRIGDPSLSPLIPAMPLNGADDDSGCSIVFEMGNIGYDYPYDIAYNAVSLPGVFIHNTEYTAPPLLDRVRAAGTTIINVRQGYTKCSCVTVGDHAIITSDKGIARAVEAYNEMLPAEPEPAASGTPGIIRSAAGVIAAARDSVPENPRLDVLLISEGHVSLPGFDHGFLGGASGMVGGEIFFNGSLEGHPDCEAVRSFIRAHGFHTVEFAGEPLTDIGSVIWI